jgi:NADP-dependent 3-hydroxy acid dehydrogenase YdfG
LIRNRGGILNVGSIAGFVPGPGMAVYYASKALPMYGIARDVLKDPNYWADEPIEEDE